jgi:hypothetical protein
MYMRDAHIYLRQYRTHDKCFRRATDIVYDTYDNATFHARTTQSYSPLPYCEQHPADTSWPPNGTDALPECGCNTHAVLALCIPLHGAGLL